jgi:hypothetical protein
MTAFTQFDRVVATMMKQFGKVGYIQIVTLGEYDPSTSEVSSESTDVPVNFIAFDYVRKTEGLGEEKNTLVQSGDKQILVQPPQKAGNTAIPIPKPNKDLFKIDGISYKIITAKQHNPNLTDDGAVMFELYIRE